nr:GAF domain-containing protein [Aureimonas frigidaquae]
MQAEMNQHVAVVENALARGGAARSALVASWQRSMNLHRLRPEARTPPHRLGAWELARIREPLEPLIDVAQDTLDRLYMAVGGIGCCVLLADPQGIPVERRGAPADDRTFEDWGLWTGTVWSEEAEGTNGIGTCLAEERAVTIHRDQHFLTRNTLLSCTTAPIFDHEGRLAAAIDVSSCRWDLTAEFAQLIALSVGEAARRIETDHFRAVFAQHRILVTPASDKGPGGLIAVDGDDMVVGATRGARLARDMSALGEGRPLPASLALGQAEEGFDAAERAMLLRALARHGGQVSATARSLGVSRATLHRKLNRHGIRRGA